MKHPMTAEEIQALVDAHKQLEGFYKSPHKISPDDSGLLTEVVNKPKHHHKKTGATSPPKVKGSPNAEYQQKVKELQALEQQIQQLRGSNLEFK